MGFLLVACVGAAAALDGLLITAAALAPGARGPRARTLGVHVASGIVRPRDGVRRIAACDRRTLRGPCPNRPTN